LDTKAILNFLPGVAEMPVGGRFGGFVAGGHG
jgi:hypothetical protein